MDLHYLHSSARERAGFAVQQVVVQGKEVDVPAIAAREQRRPLAPSKTANQGSLPLRRRPAAVPGGGVKRPNGNEDPAGGSGEEQRLVGGRRRPSASDDHVDRALGGVDAVAVSVAAGCGVRVAVVLMAAAGMRVSYWCV